MSSTEQAYLEKLFPNGAELPNDRLIPALLMQGERTEVILLIKVPQAQAKLLRTEHDARVLHTDISVHPVEREGNDVPDLRLGLELSYPEEKLHFHGLISDSSGKKQGTIAAALLQANRIAVFVALHDMTFVSFKAFDWNPGDLPQLRTILQDYNGKGTCT